MPLVIELITEEDLAELEAVFGAIERPPVPEEPEGQEVWLEPQDPERRREWYAKMMRENMGMAAG